MKIVVERIIYLLLCVLTISCNSKNDISLGNNDYKALVELFQDFRTIQDLPISNGVPDYTPKAIAHQKSSLDKLQRRLGLIDTTGWPIPDRVEYHLVKAEMHGLEFYHKVLKPWSRDPGFYLQTQDGAGPTRVAYFNFDEFPIPQEVLTEAKIKLIALPKVLDQAKKNLTDGADDLAYCALHYLPYEIMLYERIYKEIKQYHPDLESIAAKALGAVKQYDTWLKKNKSKMTAPAGVGKDNYNWWMKNVQLIPYTWDELYDIIMREDDRLLTTVALERNRNRDLPELKPVSSREEHAQRKIEALKHVMKFTEVESLFVIPEWIGFKEYLGGANALVTSWNDAFANTYVGSGETAEWPGVRDFFHKTADREPLPEQTHEFIGHHLDHGFHRRDDRIILGADRQYAIEMIRLEGWAFWLEEMLMHAGYLDDKSARSREIVYWQAAFRTCRAVADLKMHSNEFSLQEAIDYVAECAPNGWNIPNGPHAWYEMQTNLRYVGWHMGMVIGKLAMNQIIAEKIRQQGNDFSYKGFFKEYFAAGIIPMALIRWQLTGNDNEIKSLGS
jgi:hypothetical protein